MKKFIEDNALIQRYSPTLGGVFLFSELATLFAESHKTATYRRIEHLENAGTLQRFIKGIYVTQQFDAQVLSQKICPESYISFGNILAEHLIIGILPRNQIDAIKPGRTKTYAGPSCTIRQLGSIDHILFGYETIRGIRKATPEKALLDTLYFHQHGIQFPFDVYSDVNWGYINQEKILLHLQRYKNPKFVAFAKGMMCAAT